MAAFTEPPRGTPHAPPAVLHAGELAVQERVGVPETVADMAALMLRPYLTDQLRAFFPTLPFVVAAARDGTGRPWATLLAGEPGLAASPDERTLRLDARPAPGDALEGAFVAGARVGLLGIELETRRRNRVNGTVLAGVERSDAMDGAADGTGRRVGVDLGVDQAFGNCPQYIATRRREPAPFDPLDARAERLDRLDARARAAIAAADTLFVATGHEREGVGAGMDASHRGGPKGFVEVVGERALVLPDYAGNRLFNTLGNLELDPRIGLLFVDFERAGLLQLTGRARVEWSPQPSARHPGAQRLVHVDVDAVVRLERALPWRWRDEAAARRELVVAAKRPAGRDAVALELVPRDGAPLEFAAGQHLPLELPRGPARGLVRTYSLAGDPATGADRRAPRVRLGVRRDPAGAVSRALHALERGDAVLAGAPAGDFALPPGYGPVALAGAGIGITPIVAMAHALACEGRPARVLQVARDGASAPFATELRALADAHPGLSLLTVLTRPGRDDRLGIDHDGTGRPDAALVGSWLPGPDVDARLCGPPGFVGALTALLIGAGGVPGRIVSESF